MPRSPYTRLSSLRRGWDRSPFHGGLLGIASVALATFAVGILCALVAVIVSLIY